MTIDRNQLGGGGGDLWFLVWVGLGMWLLMTAFFAARPPSGVAPPELPVEAMRGAGIVIDI